jgi:hypothetical protein
MSARRAEGFSTAIPSKMTGQWLVSGLLLGLAGGCACPPVNPAAPPMAEPAPAPSAPVTVATSPVAGVRSVVRQVNYLLEAGPYSLEVDPTDGAKIVAFSLEGRSVVVSREESPEAYGSSFWPSPQSDWQWPPPLELDRKPWKASTHGQWLVLESQTSQKLGLAATQRIALDAERGAARLEFVLTNRGSSPRRVAPWQNTRIRPRGLLFYPSSEPTLPESSLKLEPVDGIVWLQHDPAAFEQSRKSYADGHEGWIALVEGGLLFIKVFPDVPREQIAPKEGEVVFYVHDSGRFVEMEQQGVYAELAPGASSTWRVQWLVRRLPPGIPAEVGNRTLVELVRGLVRSVQA